jgi:tetratricopeptide (TPR) repeat protein
VETAALYEALKRPDEALLYLNTAVRLRPGSADIHHRLALLYHETGDGDASRRHLQRAMDLGLKSSPLAPGP